MVESQGPQALSALGKLAMFPTITMLFFYLNRSDILQFAKRSINRSKFRFYIDSAGAEELKFTLALIPAVEISCRQFR